MAGQGETTDHKDIMLKTLDDIVSVNSLFMIAVFIGLTIKYPDVSTSNGIQPECQADPRVSTKLVVVEILSFVFFLCSSLLAKSLKIYLNMFYKTSDGLKPVRGIAFAFSVVGSIVGVGLLIASLTFLLEMKVGKLSCPDPFITLVSSCAIVAVPLLAYLGTMFYAVLHSMAF